SVTVAFKHCPPPFIPNIITLNGDGKNETFAPQHLPEGPWQLQIFSRWGNKIYESSNYQNTWPETDIGGGTYYYLLKKNLSGQKFKGWLEVVK
ncbi:MAG TPA: gliding motility-associated C-terminal domain-containing protein, partial [Adhaeribacter sp.]|nr:gliding motility-associated C-terminal domain-containing protein [Adhaeribacter sp.]